jgi:flagellin
MSANARGLSTLMQQLSAGKRISNAVDDVAGMAISTRLTSGIRELNQAVRDTNDDISLIQTAEGATEQMTNTLQRTREPNSALGAIVTALDTVSLQRSNIGAVISRL